jgi:hypothetical protein
MVLQSDVDWANHVTAARTAGEAPQRRAQQINEDQCNTQAARGSGIPQIKLVTLVHSRTDAKLAKLGKSTSGRQTRPTLRQCWLPHAYIGSLVYGGASGTRAAQNIAKPDRAPQTYLMANRGHSLGAAPGDAMDAVLSSGRPPRGLPLARGEPASMLRRPQRLDEPAPV